MKAAVYKGNQRFEIEEIPTPSPGPTQILVKVKYCAICGTDVHGFLYDAVPPGTVMGHEYCGTVAEVGADVTRWKPGDRVVGGGGDIVGSAADDGSGTGGGSFVGGAVDGDPGVGPRIGGCGGVGGDSAGSVSDT